MSLLQKLASDSAVLTTAGSSFHHCGARTERSCDFEDSPTSPRPWVQGPCSPITLLDISSRSLSRFFLRRVKLKAPDFLGLFRSISERLRSLAWRGGGGGGGGKWDSSPLGIRWFTSEYLKNLKRISHWRQEIGTAERWNISIYFYPISRYI